MSICGNRHLLVKEGGGETLMEQSGLCIGGDPMGTLTEQLAELCQDNHYPPLFLQGVAMGNNCIQQQ